MYDDGSINDTGVQHPDLSGGGWSKIERRTYIVDGYLCTAVIAHGQDGTEREIGMCCRMTGRVHNVSAGRNPSSVTITRSVVGSGEGESTSAHE